MSRTYAIADMHGRYDLLREAVSTIEFVYGEEGGKIIILGDFVDRGPQSRSIIELLMRGARLPGWEWIVLQGNHEAMMVEVLKIRSAELVRWWIGNGGGETLRSYGYVHGDPIAPVKVPSEHLDWLASLPVSYEDEHRIYVHAGVPFDRALDEASRDTLQWMLYPGDVEHGDAEFHPDQGHLSGKHIVHGHHQSADHPLLKSHRTNLDSWAYRTGRLAIGVFDDAKPGGPVEVLFAEGAEG